MLRLKVAAWVIGVLILSLIVVWFAKSIVCRSALDAQAAQYAESLARSIAAFGNKDFAARNYSDLQNYSDDLVRRKPVAFVAMLDRRGRVVVHTNRAYLGKNAADLTPPAGVNVESAMIMGVTDQVGTAMVGVRLE
jgi:sensor histidine kinase regulating citrate/malate metabolism